MALSMEEQRILAQIEQELTRAEPALATRLSTFADQSPAAAFRSARLRVMASLAALLMLAVTSVAVYTFLTLRGSPPRGESARPTAAARSVIGGPSERAGATTPAMSSRTARHQTPTVIMRGQP
ncbi:MAG TPA: DUF3040 domain-containing protein [Streptosporangiaceae bacterium]